MLTQASLALLLTLVQLGLFALCWALVAALLPAERRSALAFLLLCAFDACAAWLHVQHAHDIARVAYTVMSLSLANGALVALGVDAYVHGRPRHARTWMALVGGGLAAIWLSVLVLGEQAPLSASLGYQLGTLALLVLPLAWFQRPLRAEFGRYAWLPLLPFALMALAVTGFLVHAAIDPDWVTRSFRARVDGGASSLLPFAITSGLFHITWLAMMLGRQVLRARRLARTDSLTQTLLRRAFEEELAGALGLAARLGHPLALAFVDVDHFKRINDRGGHAAGDRVLQQLGAVLTRTLRGSDRCGRWGGEEFVLLLPAVDGDGARTLIGRLVQALAEAGVPVPDGCAALTVSVGVAVWQPAQPVSAQVLIAQADAAMYEAKRRGRNTVVMVTPPGREAPPASGGGA